MKVASLNPSDRLSTRPARVLDAARRALVLGSLAGWREGVLTLALPDGARHVFGTDATAGSATLRVHDEAFFARVVAGGGIGLGESYMEGEWTADDLPTLVALFCRQKARHGLSTLRRFAAWADRLTHRFRWNTRRGARANIAAHYDLGNDFYRLWLDPTLAYSCGIYEHATDDLAAAQQNKYRRICEKLRLRADDHLVEIGTGWGGFALHAARTHGCRVTTTTISLAQRTEAIARVASAGLADRVTVLDRDFRDLDGSFDKLVSIEMFEAIGRANFEPYFRQCGRLLKPDGLGLVQTITIPDARFEDYARGCDWLQKYIFPGALVPSLSVMLGAMARASDLVVQAVDDIGAHYAPTLAAWRTAFFREIDAVRALGFDDRFVRMWDYYLASCEGAFRSRTLGDVQVVIAHPGSAALCQPAAG